jgi:L-alanine-DL-glutamate epimerase-like enolase superfamily enzyme
MPDLSHKIWTSFRGAGHVSDCPFREEILREPFVVKGGKVDVPQKPGLGVDINPKVMERYLVKL